MKTAVQILDRSAAGLPSGRATWAPALHLCCASVVLVICLLLPRPGTETLLVPIGASTVFPVLATHDSRGLRPRIMGRGVLQGSVLVRFGDTVPWLDLVRQGVVPIAAPAFLCSGKQQ